MLYIVFFIICFIVLVLVISILILMLKGYRITYEKGSTDTFKRIPRLIKKATEDIKDYTVTRTVTISKDSNNAYAFLKKEYPDLDLDKVKDDIKEYILAILKDGNKKTKMKTTGTFKCEIDDLFENKKIDKDSIHVLQTLLGNYTKENDVVKVNFNTDVEFKYKYSDELSREAQKAYSTEFVLATRNDLNKKIKNTVKQKNVKNSQEEYGNIETGVWYLNRIKEK